MSYVDGFLVLVASGNEAAYLEMKAMSTALFKEFGATRVVACRRCNHPDSDAKKERS